MSTSYSPAPGPAGSSGVRPFPYAEASGGDPGDLHRNSSAAVGEDTRNSQETDRREAAAREAGRQEGATETQARIAEELSRERACLSNTLRGFAQEREAFYQKVEAEVVNLALSIARKILHREAQVDPLLLAGMVRVTLEKIEASTEVVLRVHPQLAPPWRDYFARSLEARNQPEVVEDPTLEADRCVIQTLLGKTDVGLDVQLKEIEQGLLDLLAQRPRVSI